MVKKALKRILSMGCVATLFMTTPGMTALAGELQEDIRISDDNSSVSVMEESVQEVVEEEMTTETKDAAEDSKLIAEDSTDADQEEDYSLDEELSDGIAESQTDCVEEAVGANIWTVGDGVTASLVKEEDKDVLYFDSNGGTLWSYWYEELGSSAGIVDIIKFTKSSTVMNLPRDSSRLFGGRSDIFPNLEEILLDKVDTSNVTDMAEMFCGSRSLAYLDLSKFDTSKVMYMNDMFRDCSNLKSLDLSNFDTSNVIVMNGIFGMFRGCSSLTSLNLSKFNTSNETSMRGMFDGCSSLTSLDLSNFDTSNVTDMSDMFRDCSSLKSLNLSKFDTSKVKDMSRMFYGCRGLTSLDISSFDTLYVTNMDSMFSLCTNLKAIDLSSFDISNVTDSFSLMASNFRMLKTPQKTNQKNPVMLPCLLCDVSGKQYSSLQGLTKSITLYCDISGCDISLSSGNWTYDGTEIEPAVKVYYHKEHAGSQEVMTYDEEYTYSYLNNREAGTATVKVTGKGLCRGEKDVSFTIDKAYPTLSFAESYINKTTLDEPFVNELTKTTDGEVSFESSDTSIATVDQSSGKVTIKGVGSVTITATAEEGKNYEASSISYNLWVARGQKDISNCTVTLSPESFTYDGNPKTPTVTVKDGDTTLTSGTDYTLSYRNNMNAGTGSVVVYGGGQYKGSKEAAFTIKTLSLSSAEITGIENKTYNGRPQTQNLIIKVGEKRLSLDRDYALSYTNNTNAGTATVIVTGKGSCTGTVKATFTIAKAKPILSFRDNIYLKSVLDGPFTNALTKTTDGKVTFAASDTAVATVDSSGLVTLKAEGMTLITVTAAEGNNYLSGSASYGLMVSAVSIESASVGGVSLSYGYSGKAYTPALTVKVNGVTLKKDTDYTVRYSNNVKPGTAKITVTGKGNYKGTKTKTFEIVNCASSIVSGKTYLLIPKNNSKTAVCAIGGKMVNNTKVYITDRGNSESQKFKAVKNSDGTWKFINAKCELALAVQQNSSALGAGLVLYDQNTRPAQNWKMSKKADNSFAIINSVTGYSIAMSDKSAVKGTTLSMAETASVGHQRFYIVETSDVSAPFDGTKSIRAARNKSFGLNITSSSKEDGANVNLYTYTNTNAKKFKIVYSGGGYYRLVNVNSGLCLTVKGNSKADGANIIQSKWAAQSGQRWKIKKNSDGTVTITSMLGTVLHLLGNRTTNNTNVHARKAASTTAQKWYLN